MHVHVQAHGHLHMYVQCPCAHHARTTHALRTQHARTHRHACGAPCTYGMLLWRRRTHDQMMKSERRMAAMGSTTHRGAREAAARAEAIASELVSTSFRLSCSAQAACMRRAHGAHIVHVVCMVCMPCACRVCSLSLARLACATASTVTFCVLRKTALHLHSQGQRRRRRCAGTEAPPQLVPSAAKRPGLSSSRGQRAAPSQQVGLYSVSL